MIFLCLPLVVVVSSGNVLLPHVVVDHSLPTTERPTTLFPSKAPSRSLAAPPRQSSAPSKTIVAQEQKPLYRLGDGLKFYPRSPGCDYYPDSIVCAYRRRTNASNSVPDLLKVLEARNQSEVPEDHVVVLHARIGDGLCVQKDRRCPNATGRSDCWNNANDCYVSPLTPFNYYALPKEYYNEVIEELSSTTTAKKVVVMGNSLHFQALHLIRWRNTSADEIYISHLTTFLKSKGFEVQLRLNGDPDTDFAYACAARTFVRGGGGFSRLIAEVVKARGKGTVLPSNTTILFDEKRFADGPPAYLRG